MVVCGLAAAITLFNLFFLWGITKWVEDFIFTSLLDREFSYFQENPSRLDGVRYPFHEYKAIERNKPTEDLDECCETPPFKPKKSRLVTPQQSMRKGKEPPYYCSMHGVNFTHNLEQCSSLKKCKNKPPKTKMTSKRLCYKLNSMEEGKNKGENLVTHERG